jgi:predicted GTPase
MEDMIAMTYEFIIRRAFNSERGQKGGDADVIRALAMYQFDLAENPNNQKIEKKFQKQLDEVKKYLHNAMDKNIKIIAKMRGNNAVHLNQLTTDMVAMPKATSLNQLRPIIERTMDTMNALNIGK